MESISCPICMLEECIAGPGDDSKWYECRRCGNFTIVRSARLLIEQLKQDDERRWTLSYYVRQRHSVDSSFEIDSVRYRHIVDNAQLPMVQEQADNIILWLARALKYPEERKKILPILLASIVGCRGASGVQYIVQHLHEKGLIKLVTPEVNVNKLLKINMTFEGWQYYNKLQLTDIDSKLAFMAMSYGNDILMGLYNSSLKLAVKQTGFDLRLLNEILEAGLIDDQLRSKIRRSAFMISDLTDENRGAYWEAGFAEGLGIPVIYLCEESKFDDVKTHFDTNHLTTVKWSKENFGNAVTELKGIIRNTLPHRATMAD